MRLLRTDAGSVVEEGGAYVSIPLEWDAIVNHEDLHAYLRAWLERGPRRPEPGGRVLAPIGTQEVWAAGVTYLRSRTARTEESRAAGGSSFYDRVYEAERPELFPKAAAWRVRGPGDPVRIRGDARWSVPEPELALCIDRRGRIVGTTIGNDMSARDIEGENPLYLPQAKIYDGACALGPALLVGDALPQPETPIELRVRRDGRAVFEGATTLARMRRRPEALVAWLFRETSFPSGCVLLTGTGVVPPEDFSLLPGDEIDIHIPPIGRLVNRVEEPVDPSRSTA